jgi:hypothetical protein
VAFTLAFHTSFGGSCYRNFWEYITQMFWGVPGAPTQPFQISLGRVAIVCPFQKAMSSPTNEIKACTKLPSMSFPYLVMLLILLPFVLFRMHSGLVRHNLCGTRRRVKWRVQKCTGRWAFLHRVYGVLSSQIIPRFGLRPQWISRRLIFRDMRSADLMSFIADPHTCVHI